jgi:hypothetical protein
MIHQKALGVKMQQNVEAWRNLEMRSEMGKELLKD